MPVEIRRAGAADAATLMRVGGELFVQTYEDSISAEEMARHVQDDFGETQQAAELNDPSIISLLVEDDGRAVGFAQLRLRPLPPDADGNAQVELWRIYLDRAYHGHGVALALLRQLGEEARAEGAVGMWLAVWEKNDRAIAFYTKHGFEEVGSQDFHVGGEVHRDLVLCGSVDAFFGEGYS